MIYTLYLRLETGDHFLQKSDTLEELQSSHSTVLRWISQMDLRIKNPSTATLVIAKFGVGFQEAKFIAGGRRVWRELSDPKKTLIRIPLGSQVIIKSQSG
jgi:hypothetical protein